MAASKNAKSSTAESVKQLHYLAGALKAPRITEAAERLADQARDAGIRQHGLQGSQRRSKRVEPFAVRRRIG